MKTLAGTVLFAWCAATFAAEVIPPAPAQYFNDYANVVSSATAARLNKTLEDFERETSNQILVVVYPKMQSGSSLEDYTVRVAQAWRVGQKAKDNGAVLFVFVQEHRVRIEVGYGLEGALPDALAKRIIDEQITPRFRAGDFDGGLSAGVNAILAATRGEYKGTGRTVGQPLIIYGNRQQSPRLPPVAVIIIAVAILFLLLALSRRQRGWIYYGGGWTGGGGWRGGGGWGGGGGFSGGGGFRGGGGSFGGGGASGSW